MPMSFKMNCPHCGRTLNVTEPAFGQTVPCPGCNRPVEVPHPSEVPSPPPQSPAPGAGRASEGRESHVPPEMPAMPPTVETFAFLNLDGDAPARRGAPAGAVQGLNLADMFAGIEKEHVFRLLPGEEPLQELMIEHQHFFVINSGITRITLTTQRLLYSATRVFSPVYWLLLVLFPPLMLYYIYRMIRNRSVSMPLDSIDSVEKDFRPNWLLFILATLAAYLLAAVCAMAVVMASDHPDEHMVLVWTVRSIVLGLSAPAVLALLLATRVFRFVVRSDGANRFAIAYNPGDRGVSEESFDDFFDSVHSQMEYVRTLRLQSNTVPT
jgi:hypothetical protein